MRGLPLAAASGGHSSSGCAGLSLSWPLLLRSTGSRCAGWVVVAHGPSCSATCGIFPDQGSNPCPLHWQADSQPLCHQGSLAVVFKSVPLFGGRITINNLLHYSLSNVQSCRLVFLGQSLTKQDFCLSHAQLWRTSTGARTMIWNRKNEAAVSCWKIP